MIRFESDYLEGCCPQILDALRETNLEQTLGYGEDPHCAKAADMIRYGTIRIKVGGIVLYTGEHTLPFGKSLYAVPMGTLCT